MHGAGYAPEFIKRRFGVLADRKAGHPWRAQPALVFGVKVPRLLVLA
jgi:hypothetical protein